jgi:drug/metabolite transporter (DMT)-like permease
MKLNELLALLWLAALWGASFLFIRISSPVLGPFVTIQGRVTIAAVALILYMLFTKQNFGWKERWRQYLILGALNATIPFMFIAFAALQLDASMSAILNSLTPLFTSLVVWGWLNERMTARKTIGIIIGIIGVAVLVGWSTIPSTTEAKIAILLSVLSTISYGFAGVYTKKAFIGAAPLSLATGQQIGATLLLFPFTIYFGPKTMPTVTSEVILAVIGLAILCTAWAYLLYFYLIENVGPTKTLSVTFLVPLFGMLWGLIFLHEQITFPMVLGLCIILSSILLITEIPFRVRARRGNR